MKTYITILFLLLVSVACTEKDQETDNRTDRERLQEIYDEFNANSISGMKLRIVDSIPENPLFEIESWDSIHAFIERAKVSDTLWYKYLQDKKEKGLDVSYSENWEFD